MQDYDFVMNELETIKGDIFEEEKIKLDKKRV
jgi:hypothetical protein